MRSLADRLSYREEELIEDNFCKVMRVIYEVFVLAIIAGTFFGYLILG